MASGKRRLFTAVLVLATAASASARGNSAVTETSSSFSCCRSPSLQFSPDCDSIWTVHGTTFAYYSVDEPAGCSSPCTELEGGRMALDACVDVNVSTVCTEMGISVETRIQYQREPCPESQSDAAVQADVAALLLITCAAIAGGCREMLC